MILHALTEAFSFLGFYVGMPIAKEESARQWIFAVAAGMFLYVALADLVSTVMQQFFSETSAIEHLILLIRIFYV